MKEVMTLLIIVFLVILSLLFPQFPSWIVLVLYVPSVFVRINEKIGNYRDWKKINKRNEGSMLLEVANGMAKRGASFSGIKIKAETKVKEDFEYERKRKKRRFWVEIIDSFILK